MTSISSHALQFREAMRKAGITPPDTIIDSGKIERFGRNQNCWYIFHNDGIPAGTFGDWSNPECKQTWQANIGRSLTFEENLKLCERIQNAKAQAEASLKIKHQKAAVRAQKIWEASRPASHTHAYLARKGIGPYNLRQTNSRRLVVPFTDILGRIQTLQFISEDGSKRFLAGGKKLAAFYRFTQDCKSQSSSQVYIAEGFSTAASIENVTNFPVVIAGDAGNLVHVAKAIKANNHDISIIICGDNDETGRKYANQAAESVNGIAIFPPNGFNDFNDLAQVKGPKSVRLTLLGWSTPQEIAEAESADYPIERLPQKIKEAVAEVRQFVQAPVSLIATSALSAVSLAIQAHVDVKRAEGLSGPCSLFALIIADSGERKTTCDRYFMSPIIDWEKEQLTIAGPLMKEYEAKYDAWQADYEGIKLKIKDHVKSNKSTNELKEQLEYLKLTEPEEPRIPRLRYGDITPEELGFRLSKKWPSAGVISNEAGSIFGSHGMNKDNVMKSLSLFNQLWDGSDVSSDRRTTDSWSTDGARLTLSLQVQEDVLRNFLEKTGTLARGSGFLARFLIACPASTQGYRPFVESDQTWPKLTEFHRKLIAILRKDIVNDPLTKGLRPKTLILSISAKKLWINFYNQIESMLVIGGDLYTIRDVASKVADNAARLAALFQFFENDDSEKIEDIAMQSAICVVAWHLNEAKRFLGELSLAPELTDAVKFDNWILGYCKNNHVNQVERSFSLQHGPLRSKAKLDGVLKELFFRNRARQEKVKGKVLITVNPMLLRENIE